MAISLPRGSFFRRPDSIGHRGVGSSILLGRMFWRVAIFFALLVIVTASASIYVVRRACEVHPMGPGPARVITWGLFLSCALPLVRFVAPDESWVSTFGFGVGLACVLASALLVVVDLASAIAARAGEKRAAIVAGQAPTMPRRELFRRVTIGASLTSAVAASTYGIALGRYDYVLEEVPVRLPRLPRTLDGYTIAQLSDVHLGSFVGRREIRAARDLVARTRADLVVLTGDLVDHDPRYLVDLGLLVRAMDDAGARDGVVAILGNHDDYTGSDEVTATLRAAGVRVLRNDAMTLGDSGGRIALLGVDDVYAARNGYGSGPDLTRAIAAFDDQDAMRILLCHNPSFFTEASARIDLQLSGHTHGGQLNFGLRPADLVMPYVAGRYVRGDAQLYVNRGFGTAGPPARIDSAPEVTRIVLVAS